MDDSIIELGDDFWTNRVEYSFGQGRIIRHRCYKIPGHKETSHITTMREYCPGCGTKIPKQINLLVKLNG